MDRLSVIFLIIISCFISQTVLCANNFAGTDSSATKSMPSFAQIKISAENGDADAQYALGYLYYYGKDGAPKDVELAKMWITKAAQQKQSQAVKALALMNSRPQQSQTPSQTLSQKPATAEKETNNSNMYTSSETSNPVKAESKETVKPTESAIKKDHYSDYSAQQEPASTPMAAASNKKKVKTDDKEKQSTPIAAGTGFTLQLLGSSQKDQIVKLVRDYQLEDAAKVYKTTFQDKEWYVLIYGQYKTRSDAQQAAMKIQQKHALKPWVKSYESIKQFKLTSVPSA